MPTISLTHFVDFVSKVGTPKLTLVKNVKEQLANAYDPASDFYKTVRDGIIEMHKKGDPKTTLDVLLTGLGDHKKQTAYPPIVAGYKKFLGRKAIAWFDPPREEWTHAGLAVNVNPELGLNINGVPHAIKLYFKAVKLTKLRIDIATQLMELALGTGGSSTVFGVLDVRNARLFTSGGTSSGVIALLRGEAASFAEVYASV